MNTRLLHAAAIALAASGTTGSDIMVGRPDPWLVFRARRSGKRERPSAAALRGKPFSGPGPEVDGYFWKKDIAGPHWRLYRKPPRPEMRSVIYDALHDRTIIESGWGYIKPTYHHGDVR